MLCSRKYCLRMMVVMLLAMMAPTQTWAQYNPNAEQELIIGEGDAVGFDRAVLDSELGPIGTGTSTSTSGSTYSGASPMGNTYREYSTTQFIFTSSEMGSAKTLKSISFHHNDGGALSSTSLRIYLIHNTSNLFDVSGGTPIPISSGATLVYQGTDITIGGTSDAWETYTFNQNSNKFDYDGTHSLVVIVCRGYDSNYHPWSNDPKYYYTGSQSNYNYIHRASDTDATWADYTNTSNAYTRSTERPNVKFTYTTSSYSITAKAYPQSVGCTVKINNGTATQTSTTASVSGSTTLTATAASGYQFVNWTGSDGNVVSYSATYTFTPSATATYQANFTSTTPISVSASSPWTETFESYGHEELLPGTWATPMRYLSLPQVVQWNPHQGNRSLEMREKNGASCMAVLPLFDKPLNTLTLSFWRTRGNSSSGYTVQVGYITDVNNPNSFTALETVSTPSSTGHVQYTSNFSSTAPSSSSYRLAIKYTQSGEDSWYFDDFEVTYTPPAVTPEITSVVPSCTSATVNWTGNSSTYTVKYIPVVSFADFETGDMSQASFTTTTNDHPWSVTSNGSPSGSYCVKSYSGVSNLNSDMVLSVTLSQAGKLSFSAKISSESDYDKGYFSIDGTVQSNLDGISGAGSWNDYSYDLSAGTHTLRWYYTKDGSVNSNDDCFYVDDIVVVGSSWTTATSSATGSSYTITGLTENTSYQVTVQGNDSDPSDAVVFTTLTPNTISVSANDASYGTVSGGGSYCAGSSCTVTASPNDCYKFVNWTENGTQVSTNASYTFTVSGDRTLVANFDILVDTDDIAVSGTTTISCGNTTTLTASGIDGATYKWYSDAACTNLVYTGASFTTSALSTTTTYYVKAVKASGNEYAGTPTSFEYQGSAQTYSIPSGATSVKLEVWGAQGGNTDTRRTGGKGGYSYGRLSTPNGGTLYVGVGGQGTSDDGSFSSSTLLPGGWNGGGAGRAWGTVTHGGGGGGGATHIAKAAPSSGSDYQLRYYNSNQSDVLIVAGGGGGSSDNGNGGAGGGTSGIAGSGDGGCSPGTQSSGSAWGYATDCTYTGGECGGGGGGYYGGYSATAENYAGGGGSGYLNLSLTDAQTIDGDNTMTNPSGGDMTGREGNGYARITPYYQGVCESEPVAVTVTVNCTSTMTYNANGGSGTMTDPNSPYNYGSTVTVLANSFTAPSDYVFNCWNTAADGSGTKYVAGDTFTITANTTLYAQWAPLVIANTTQWDEFASAVNSGFTYSGLTVTMTADVGTVTRMVGTSSNVFRGTFNGQCYTLDVNISSEAEFCGPFCYTYGATIENLKVTGTINTSHKHTGGVVGRNGTGKLTLTNVLSSVTINSSYSGSGEQGGLVGYAINGEFKGCAFTGKLLGASTTQSGGLLGWKSNTNDSNVVITDCLFAPTQITMSTSGGHTLAHGTVSKVTITNSYYTTQFGTAQGKQAYTLDMVASPAAGGTVSHTGSGTEYGCSGIMAYAPGLAYDIDNDAADELLLGNGESATLTASANSGYTFMNWTDRNNTPIDNPYTVTMGTADRTVTANFINQTESDDWTTAVSSMPSSGISIGNPTNISNANGLAWFISMVNGLNGEDGNDFSSYIINLTADVDMSAHTWVPIGTVEHPFSGTFNGNGHVIKGITRSTDFPHDGLFGYVSGSANIQNVVVQASLTGNSHATGAVVGTFASTGTISNVEGAGTLTGGALTTALGGIAGNNSGMLHSSFAVATMTGGASATQMGGLVGNNTGDLLNSYSNATYAGTSAPKGGLVGSNSGTVENCYAAGIASGVSAFAGSNSGTIQYCYTDAVGSGYIGTNSTAPTGSGTYGAVQSSIKHLNYMYRDNLITKNTNSYVGTKDAIADGIDVYVDKHIPVWNGLVSALNQWVKEKNQVSDASSLYYNKDFTAWHRPLTTHINGDLPVLGFAKDNSLGTLDSDGKFLQYGSNQNGGNGLDVVLTTFNNSTASIFHYGKATGVTHVPTANVNVFINEDAVLLQATSPDPGAFINTTVGVTFDNSDHGTHAYDYWGNKLDYDWHFLSTPLSDAKIGATYNDYVAHGYGSDIDIKTLVNSYFPNNLPMALHDANWRWDFYTYYEPEYHWINLKRNKNNHYHVDGGWSISYTYNADDQAVGDEASLACVFTPGKGYMMAISKDVFMNSTGTLNRGNVPIRLTLKEPDDINYASGWNLVGNPYQAYLNINALNRNLYIYDADQGVYAPYAPAASDNPATPSQYIHPHQAFFVHAASDGEELIFTPTMASTETTPYSYYRDDRIDYPLVNLYAENNAGQRDLIVVEFHRPELGGARKLETMRNAPFTLAAHYAGISYGILFATDDIERIPVRFKTDENGWVTLTWNTHNGEFSKLLLIDNKLGVEHNMLADNSYTFEASPDDYSSRFYIVYDCSGMGVEENEESGASTGSATAATFAYINNGNIDIDIGSGHGASIQVIDVLGRVLYSKTIAGTDGTCTVSTKGLAKGVYLIRLADGHNVKTQKLVVQ